MRNPALERPILVSGHKLGLLRCLMLDHKSPGYDMYLIDTALKELTDLLCSLDPSSRDYQSLKRGITINVNADGTYGPQQ